MPGQSLNRNATLNALINFGATAGAYATGQVIGVPQLVANSVLEKGGTSTLVSVMLIDLALQKLAVDIYFFNQLPTSQGADKAAFALNAVEALTLLGRVSVLTTDYSAGSTVISEATKPLLNIGLVGGNQGKPNQTNNSRNVYALAVSRGAPTYGANGLQARFAIAMD